MIARPRAEHRPARGQRVLGLHSVSPWHSEGVCPRLISGFNVISSLFFSPPSSPRSQFLSASTHHSSHPRHFILSPVFLHFPLYTHSFLHPFHPRTMTWLQQWTTGLMATVALCVLLAVAEDSGLPAAAENIVKKESHPVLFRQKRHWIWNSLYVEEEKPAPIPYKIGQVETSECRCEELCVSDLLPGPSLHSLVFKCSIINMS